MDIYNVRFERKNPKFKLIPSKYTSYVQNILNLFLISGQGVDTPPLPQLIVFFISAFPNSSQGCVAFVVVYVDGRVEGGAAAVGVNVRGEAQLAVDDVILAAGR